MGLVSKILGKLGYEKKKSDNIIDLPLKESFSPTNEEKFSSKRKKIPSPQQPSPEVRQKIQEIVRESKRGSSGTNDFGHNDKKLKEDFLKRVNETQSKTKAYEDDQFIPSEDDLASNSKLRASYSSYIDSIESKKIDMADPNVQRIYNQACNYIALETYKTLIKSVALNNPALESKLVKGTIEGFFKELRYVLSRKSEVYEMRNENEDSKRVLGTHLIDRFNKAANKRMLDALDLSEDLIKKSLKLEELEKKAKDAGPDGFNPDNFNPDGPPDDFNPDIFGPNFDPDDPSTF